jgi:hypothetical protein
MRGFFFVKPKHQHNEKAIQIPLQFLTSLPLLVYAILTYTGDCTMVLINPLGYRKKKVSLQVIS